MTEVLLCVFSFISCACFRGKVIRGVCVKQWKKREGRGIFFAKSILPKKKTMPPPPPTTTLALRGAALDLAGPFAPPPRALTATTLTYADGAVYEVSARERKKTRAQKKREGESAHV